MISSNNDIFFMTEAMNMAKEGLLSGEVPIGAVVTYENKIIGRGFNQLTGRHNYRKYGYENNPEALNNAEDAAIVVARFMKNNRLYSFDEMNSADTQREGVIMAADINSGSKNKLGGRARNNAMARLPDFELLDFDSE